MLSERHRHLSAFRETHVMNLDCLEVVQSQDVLLRKTFLDHHGNLPAHEETVRDSLTVIEVHERFFAILGPVNHDNRTIGLKNS